MAWRKSSQSLIDLFDEIVPHTPETERRKMFGYPAVFVNNNMCMGLHQDNFIIRLSEADREEIKNTHNALPFEPMKGRVMREYVSLPKEILDDPKCRADWIARSYAFVSAMPSKEKKPRKRPKRKTDSN